MRWCLLFLLLTGPALADGWMGPSEPPKHRISGSFVDAPIDEVIRWLAGQMHRNVFIGPSIQATVTVDFDKVPPEGALALLLRLENPDWDYKMLSETIVVAADRGCQDFSGATERVRLYSEYNVTLLPILRERFPTIDFQDYGQICQFTMYGPSADLAAARAFVESRDRQDGGRTFLPSSFISPAFGPETALSHLRSSFPQLGCFVDGNLIVVEGDAEALERVDQLLATARVRYPKWPRLETTRRSFTPRCRTPESLLPVLAAAFPKTRWRQVGDHLLAEDDPFTLDEIWRAMRILDQVPVEVALFKSSKSWQALEVLGDGTPSYGEDVARQLEQTSPVFRQTIAPGALSLDGTDLSFGAELRSDGSVWLSVRGGGWKVFPGQSRVLGLGPGAYVVFRPRVWDE
ncbi:MAG: hypothetical protein KC910_24075 [Candidatus Eremiobacteraeota bacterium]|nr:hypothetical protein [Candidatus Eremiobacteraeota bacterium]